MKVTKEILEEVDKIKEDCLIEVTGCGETDTYFVDKGYDEKNLRAIHNTVSLFRVF